MRTALRRRMTHRQAARKKVPSFISSACASSAGRPHHRARVPLTEAGNGFEASRYDQQPPVIRETRAAAMEMSKRTAATIINPSPEEPRTNPSPAIHGGFLTLTRVVKTDHRLLKALPSPASSPALRFGVGPCSNSLRSKTGRGRTSGVLPPAETN